jgi:hypothetical protein
MDGSRELREVCKVTALAKGGSHEVYTGGEEIGRVSRSLRDEVSNLLASLRSKDGERGGGGSSCQADTLPYR